ncbi:MAG: type VI secretion system baseplate subunit TssE [Pirellulaceae bacterium]
MQDHDGTHGIVESIFDRLIDERPDRQSELPKSPAATVQSVREAVRRDLENLLNTPARWRSWPAELTELNRSLVAYGLPDMWASNLGAEEDRELFLRSVERIVRTFEPRFRNIVVEALDNADPLDRTMRFRIRAMLEAYPAPEPLVFDSAVDPSDGEFEVKEGSA